MPFEIYHDYWGTYGYDLAQGTLDLSDAEGNYVPPDLDGSGSFRENEPLPSRSGGTSFLRHPIVQRALRQVVSVRAPVVVVDLEGHPGDGKRAVGPEDQLPDGLLRGDLAWCRRLA